MAEFGAGAWGWLTTLIPGIMPVDPVDGSLDITLTPQGTAAFPGFTNADLAGADPWHNYFTGNLGGLNVLGTAPDGGVVRNVILGGGFGTVLGLVPRFPSDQKPGSVLVYPYYTSNAQNKWDTRITLTNTAGTLSVAPAPVPMIPAAGSIYVHIFFLRGGDCQQSDMYVCLTKGASISFKMSEQDPETTGYVVAVAVDGNGFPISYNTLIGNAFVTAGDNVGNYGAEAFAALPAIGQPTANAGAGGATATLGFNGGIAIAPAVPGYDRGADQFAVEIQSPNDATGQAIVHVSLNGDIAGAGVSSVAQAGTGLVVRGDEKQGSFVRFISGNCQSVNVINAGAPRVPTGLGIFLPKGSIGTVVYNTNVGSVGLLITPKPNAWSGIRTIHKTRLRDSALIIPVFMPVC